MNPIPMIVGTDWWTDCDDCMAMRVLARMHARGVIRLLGAGMNACMEDSVRSLDGFLLHEGLDVPVGIDHAATQFPGNPPYQRRLAQNLESKYKSNADAPDAVALYRRLIAESSEPVHVVEIGFLQVLEGLLKSGPDEISPLSGMELAKQKIAKCWIMAGKWDEPDGLEHNFCLNDLSRRAGQFVCDKFPGEITFLGWEVSNEIRCGAGLCADDPLYLAMKDHHSENGRSAWDPMLCLLACLQDESAAGYRVVRGCASVDPETGANHFAPGENGKHCYVVKREADAYYRDAVDAILRS